MKKFLAIILLLTFWLIFPLSFFLFTFAQTLLSGQYYKIQLEKNNTYTQLLEFVGENLTAQSDLAQIPGLAQADVQEIINSTFSPQWLQANFEKIIDASFGLLEPGAQISHLNQVNIDLAEPKSNLSPLLGSLIKERLAELPSCDAETEAQIVDFSQLDCVPYGLNLAEEIPIEDLSGQLLGGIPDQINLLDSLKSSDISEPDLVAWQVQLDLVQYWLGIVKIVLIIALFLSGFFFLILGLLFIRQPRSLLAWWGTALFTPGIIGLGIFLPAKLFFLNAKYLQPLIWQYADLPLEFVSLNTFLAELLEALLSGFINRLLLVIGLCFILGLVFYIISRFIPKPHNLTK